jgi:26S proteasome regulatory subunit (ATPase 3-interacting protein)
LLEDANLPALDYHANVHLLQVTKTAADKLLREMEQNNQVMGKATNGDKKGSQWVFWASQVDTLHPHPVPL